MISNKHCEPYENSISEQPNIQVDEVSDDSKKEAFDVGSEVLSKNIVEEKPPSDVFFADEI